MGVPVVSLLGDGFIGRMAGDILIHTGLSELTVRSMDEYLEKVVELAGDLARLRGLRAGMRERIIGSPVCDYGGYARAFERGLMEMWAGVESKR